MSDAETSLKICNFFLNISLFTGISGALVEIWINPSLGYKMVQSAFVVGIPALLLGLLYAASKDDEKKGDEKSE